MFVKAPAKVIISGEHSVVYGHKAICAAINKFTTLKITPSKEMEIRWGNVYRELYHPGQENSSIGKILNILPMNPSLIEVESEVPLSSGLGSSASFAVALTKAFGGNLQQAIEIENVFHGKRGSGLDVQVCNKGGVCVFQNQQIQKSDLKINKLLLIDSGERKQGTQASIQKVKNCVEFGDGKKIINRISEVTQQIIKEGIVKELIYENHDLLNRLGICTDTMNSIVNICKEQNIPAKMTGAGDGGFCVAFPKNQNEELSLKTALQNYQIINVEVEEHTSPIV